MSTTVSVRVASYLVRFAREEKTPKMTQNEFLRVSEDIHDMISKSPKRRCPHAMLCTAILCDAKLRSSMLCYDMLCHSTAQHRRA